MKKIILILSLLFLISPCFAGDKVYTEEDLGKYKTEQSYKSYLEDRKTETDKKIKNAERIMDLMKQGRKIVTNSYLTRSQRCRQLEAINEEAETLGADVTDLKLSLQRLCGEPY